MGLQIRVLGIVTHTHREHAALSVPAWSQVTFPPAQCAGVTTDNSEGGT